MKYIISSTLLVFAAGLLNERNTVLVQANNAPQLIKEVRMFCHVSCMNLLKESSMCRSFCSFCDHIESEHAPLIHELWLKADQSIEPLKVRFWWTENFYIIFLPLTIFFPPPFHYLFLFYLLEKKKKKKKKLLIQIIRKKKGAMSYFF